MQQGSLFIVTVAIHLQQQCCLGKRKLLTSQLLSNKLILLQAPAKGTATNPSFIQIVPINLNFILKKHYFLR